MPVQKLQPTFNLEQERIEMLKQLIPEAVSDGKIDWDVLKEALGEYLEDEGANVEHFGLSWAGKREARRLASMPSKGTLVPVLGEGIHEDTTGNIFIEGDNLEVLKLLQKSYAGRVKLIYIDPPYNTGNDFIYKDDFSEPTADYLKKTGQTDEEGNLLTSNPKSGGRFHSNWLNFMYPRIKLGKNLLKEDGVIFISCDDNEVHNLRAVLNEVFGEENFVAQIIVQSNKRGQTYKDISKTHEYLICYTNESGTSLRELEKESNDLKFIDSISTFDIRELRNRNPKFGKFNRPNLFFPIYASPISKNEDGFCSIALEKSNEYSVEVFPLNSEGKESCWRWSRNKISKENVTDISRSSLIAKQRRDGGWNIYEKYRKTTYKAKSIWDENDVISEQGTIDLRDVGLKGIFDFPKPVNLIKKVIALGSEEEDIILDFFAGSATLAHSLFKLNLEDDGNRKFICVQLPELTDEKSEAFQAGYRTIAEISKERIRRVIKKIKDEQAPKLDFSEGDPQDLGFKVYKLDRSNLKIWKDYDGEDIPEFEQLSLNFQNPLGESFSEEKVVTELQLLEGFPLDSKIDQSDTFTQNKVLCVTSEHIEHRLFICLDNKLDIATVQDVQLLEDEDIFVCLDNALTDQEKMMLADGCNVKTI
jgi:adenine-specific DNA-methyltransferase